jgi:hypothetical protein
MKSKFGNVLTAALLGWVGIKGALWVATDTLTILDSRNWATTSGTIDRAWLKGPYGRGREYSPNVEYSFTVNGNRYTGNRLEIPARRSGDRGFEQSRVDQLLRRRAVGIFYDPRDPRQSVVSRPAMNYWFTVGLGTLALVCCAGSIAIGWDLLRGHNKRLQRSQV